MGARSVYTRLVASESYIMKSQLPPELTEDTRSALNTTGQIVRDYLAALRFVVGDASRSPDFGTTHLLSYLSQDFIESAASIVFLARSGSLSVPKRELRFILESSIKLCFIQQKNDRSPIADKLKQFDKTLKSPSISIKDDLKLWMLPASAKDAFDEELGRLYGKTSSYVHLTPSQIAQRIAAVDAGRTIGYENAADVDDLNALIAKGFATSLVLLFHSVGEYVAGDFLVDSDGSTVISYFLGSRFIAEMDSYFDYKAERQPQLSTLREARAALVRF
jgi:hypothetical protein